MLEQLELSHVANENANLKIACRFLTKLNIHLPYGVAISLLAGRIDIKSIFIQGRI